VLAVALAWALHAGVDWLWEQPAVSLPIFALAGAALARAPREALPRAAVPVRVGVIAACVGAAFVTGRLALAASDLQAARTAAARGHCDEAIRRARDSLRIRANSDGQLILADCLLRTHPLLALAAIERAAADDPHDWRVRYDRALVLAVNHRDPRRESEVAHLLNSHDPAPADAMLRFESARSSAWPVQGLREPFLLP